MTQEGFLWWLSLDFYSFSYLTFHVCFSLPWNVCPFHSSDVYTEEFPVNDLFVSLGRETAGEMKRHREKRVSLMMLQARLDCQKCYPRVTGRYYEDSYWKRYSHGTNDFLPALFYFMIDSLFSAPLTWEIPYFTSAFTSLFCNWQITRDVRIKYFVFYFFRF